MREQSTSLTKPHTITRKNGGRVSEFFLTNYSRVRGIFSLVNWTTRKKTNFRLPQTLTLTLTPKKPKKSTEIKKHRFVNQPDELHRSPVKLLNQLGETLVHRLKISPTLLSCSSRFLRVYNRTEHSQGFFIC